METLLEGLQKAINDAEEAGVDEKLISNLQTYCDRIYYEWDKGGLVEGEELKAVQEENQLLRELLRQRLTHEEMIDIRIHYGIDIEWGE